MTSIGLTSILDDERYNTSDAINDGNGGNTEVIKLMEQQFLTQNWDYWEPILKENEIPYQRLFTTEDILADEEAYDNDILRKLEYDEFGTHALTTSPIRFKSVGDPVLYKSRPVGSDTAEVMEEFGYSASEIQAMNGTSVKCYDGPPLPDSVFKPSYGPNSLESQE